MRAKKVTFDGVEFRSPLEAFCYKELKKAGISSEYEKTKFILQPSFRFNGKHVHPITYTPDFIGKGFVIETKGHKTESFNLKWKMFMRLLIEEGKNYRLFMPRNQKQVLDVIECIRTGKEPEKSVKSRKSPDKVIGRKNRTYNSNRRRSKKK